MNGSGRLGRASLLRRLREERGFKLVELITTMAIMLFVITALVQLSTSGTKAENDLNLRFQAQEEARLGLDMFRREVHNACAATIAGRRHAGHADEQRHERARQLPVQRRRLELVHERERDALRRSTARPAAARAAAGLARRLT